MFKLYCYELMIEVTRRCNMKCEHCLRGSSQKIDITNEIIDKTLKDINSINTISFTGGEPFLNPNAIIYIFNKLEKNKIEYYNFWLATNGKIWNPELIDLFIQKSAELKIKYNDEENSCHLAVSEGMFHEGQNKKIITMFKELSMYDSSKKYRQDILLIDEGRAKRNYLGKREPLHSGLQSLELNNDTYEYNDIIYINALGDVLLSCDTSYQTQKKIKIGNILENTLLSILLKEKEKQI